MCKLQLGLQNIPWLTLLMDTGKTMNLGLKRLAEMDKTLNTHWTVYLLRCFPRSLLCKLCNVFGTMLTCQIVPFYTTEVILADSVCFQSANGQTDYWHRVIYELVKILKSKLFAQSIIWKQNQMFVQVKANSLFYCGIHSI